LSRVGFVRACDTARDALSATNLWNQADLVTIPGRWCGRTRVMLDDRRPKGDDP